MLKLKVQYFGHLIQRAFGKGLMLGKTEGKRRREWQRMRWLAGITDSIGHESDQTLGDSEASPQQRDKAQEITDFGRESDVIEINDI